MGPRRIRAWRAGSSVITALSIMIVGCSLPSFAPAAEPTALATSTSTEVAAEPTQTIAEATDERPTVTPPPGSPTTAANLVTLRATGNLFIRRGPGQAYNQIGYMQNGQQTIAHGRNSSGDWLYVERPDSAGNFGWVSRGIYASVEGDPLSLEVMSFEPAAPAYLRNCTFHPMRILPGDFILAEQFDAPNNQHQMNPGTYEAYDQNVEGDPLVLSPTIREGQTVDITTDGLNSFYACPG